MGAMIKLIGINVLASTREDVAQAKKVAAHGRVMALAKAATGGAAVCR
jgi:hypothetical protein